ncbi:hypothetical protein [Bacillus idriensis]|uniref:hypothetical protein n=2 Tax=Metabacillus idriensis TaxID=324768 RepID=UPI001748E4EC
MEKMTENRHLLEVYRTLWSNRKLAGSESDLQTLQSAIKVELMDEMTHPRLRKNIDQKFFLAAKRITESTISSEDKTELIALHIKMYEEIKQPTLKER